MKKLLITFFICSTLILLTSMVTATNAGYLEISPETNTIEVGISTDKYKKLESLKAFKQKKFGRTSGSISSQFSWNDDSTINSIINYSVMEQIFDSENIILNKEEEKYINNYLDSTLATINGMIQDGDEAERKNAEEVLEIWNAQLSFCNLSYDEANEIVKQGLGYGIKYKKLLQSKFNNNQDDLKNYVNEKFGQMKIEVKYII